MVAILSVYMPIIRTEIYLYVRLWNMHLIRRQKNRPNAVIGKPNQLYACPKYPAQEHAIPLNRERWEDIRREDIPFWDPDPYLPASTQAWCNTQFAELGFNPMDARMDYASERSRPFLEIYLKIRERAKSYLALGKLPLLSLLQTPAGNWDYIVSY